MAQDIIARGLAIKALEEGGGGGGDHPVTSVNSKTGAITLTAGDVGATTKTYVDDQIKAIKYPVTSVNGKTGVVALTATDVGATTQSYVNSKVGDVTPLTITLTENAATGTYTSNTGYVDIKDAYDAGVPINVGVGGNSRLPLMNAEFSGDDAGFTFGYTQVQADGNAIVTRAIHYLHTTTEDTWEDADAESQPGGGGGGSGTLGDTTVNGTLAVSGATTLTGGVTGGLNVTGGTSITGTLAAKKEITVGNLFGTINIKGAGEPTTGNFLIKPIPGYRPSLGTKT